MAADEALVRLVHTSGAMVLVAAHKVDHLLSTGFARADEQEADGRPRGNASRDEWAAYAAVLGVEVPEDAKRADIKALVEAHPPRRRTSDSRGRRACS